MTLVRKVLLEGIPCNATHESVIDSSSFVICVSVNLPGWSRSVRAWRVDGSGRDDEKAARGRGMVVSSLLIGDFRHRFALLLLAISSYTVPVPPLQAAASPVASSAIRPSNPRRKIPSVPLAMASRRVDGMMGSRSVTYGLDQR